MTARPGDLWIRSGLIGLTKVQNKAGIGEGVEELVRVQLRETRRRAPSRNHLEQSRGRHGPGPAEPQVRQTGEGWRANTPLGHLPEGRSMGSELGRCVSGRPWQDSNLQPAV